jgi:putative zinc finger protein
MAPHEEYLELCAAATAGELNPDERTKLDAHLVVCPDCRRAMGEYEIVSRHGMVALASELAQEETETASCWSAEKAEELFFKRLSREKDDERSAVEEEQSDPAKRGQRFTFRPSQIRWRQVWMPFAAAVLLSLALGIAAYRTGVKRGTDVGRVTTEPPRESAASLEEQVSDRGHEHTQLVEKLAKEDQIIADLRRQLSEQEKEVNALKAASGAGRAAASGQQPNSISGDAAMRRDEELATAQAKSQQLETMIDTLMGQREELTSRAATLEAKVAELTQLVRDREQEIDRKQEEVAKQQDLLEHDRDIRDLMGARDLYIAEVHDVAGTGETNKTYGRIFYTKRKRLIFYAYDLDAQPGVRNASSFQAWGRRGPNKEQALSLGIFYEDNAAKKRWVLKASDPKTLEDIDAVFVTVEPNGGSQHPRGKQLLFAYLRISPNHP